MPGIADIDKNLKVVTSIDKPDLKFYDVRETTEFDIYGLYSPRSEEIFRRVPADVAQATNEGVAVLANHTAGGRIRFTTNSSYVAIHAVQAENSPGHMPHMTITGSSGFDLYLYQDGKFTYWRSFIPPTDKKGGYESIIEFPDRAERELLIHMPLYDEVHDLYIGLQADATLECGSDYKYDKPVVFLGSSITQGGCASRPGNAYQAIISRELDCDHINLGFSGSCRGEQAMVDFVCDQDMSVFFLDYDHNAPTPEHLAATHENVYCCVRAAHPDVPIIMASRTDLPITEGMQQDTDARRAIVKATYDKAIAAGDRNVYYIDGQTVFPGRGGDSCTVDGCHPNDLGFYAMAQVFGEAIRKVIK